MVKMRSFFHKIGGLYRKTIKRFPRSLILAALIGAIYITINHVDISADFDEIMSRMALSILFVIPLCLSLNLFYRTYSFKRNIWTNLLYRISPAVIAVVCYFLIIKDIEHQVNIVRYIALGLSSTVFFTIVTFLKGREHPEVYAQKFGWRLIITTIYNWIIVGGIEAILFAIENLLQINVPEELYIDVLIFVPTFIMPAFFLAGIPRVDEEVEETMPKLFKVLLMYVLMPILAAYTVVLYTYFVKLLIDGIWPSNMLGNLVLWYGLISVVVLYLANPTKRENGWSRLFYRVYPYLLIVPVIMMFISFGIRIEAYGITEGRYMAMIGGLWTFVCAVVFFKKDVTKSIKVVPIALSIIAILSVIGPWSAFSVSKYSQNKRFESILISNEMLVNGKIVSSEKISKEDKVALSSIIDYFGNNHEYKDLIYLPEGFQTTQMKQLMGFKHTISNRYESDIEYYYINKNDNLINVRGYDYYVQDIKGQAIITYFSTNKGNLKSFVNGLNVFEITLEGNTVYSKDLDEFLSFIYEKYPTGKALPVEELTLEDENEHISIRIIFDHISHQLEEDKSTVVLSYLIHLK